MPIKPSFPNPSTKELTQRLETFEKAVKASTAADGTLELQTLSAKLDQLGGSAELKTTLESALETVEDAFHRVKTETRSDCGGTTEVRVRVNPKALSAAEVSKVVAALLNAKTAGIKLLDQDHNHTITADEAKTPKVTDNLAGALVRDTLGGTTTAHKREMRTWAAALRSVMLDVKERGSLEARIGDASSYHAESSQGADALAWAYRDFATAGVKAEVWGIEKTLEKAETSWLRFVPFFRPQKKKGHLSDKEIRKHLGTDDLAAFVADKQAAVTARLGMDYFTGFLPGTDLEGHDQLKDPDFLASTASSTCG